MGVGDQGSGVGGRWPVGRRRPALFSSENRLEVIALAGNGLKPALRAVFISIGSR